MDKKIIDGIEYGKPTEREKELYTALGNFIADYIEKHQSRRGEILGALCNVCHKFFNVYARLEDESLRKKEIDAFAEWIKILGKVRNK